MTNPNVSAELPGQELNDIVAFNRQLLTCHQRSELNALFQKLGQVRKQYSNHQHNWYYQTV